MYDTICHRRDCLIMRYQYYSHFLFSACILKKPQHRFACRVIERACRFIAQEQLWILCKCTRDRDSLLLSARKLRREIVHTVPKSNLFKNFLRIKRLTTYLHRKFHVFLSRKIRHEIIELEYKSYIFTPIFRQFSAL